MSQREKTHQNINSKNKYPPAPATHLYCNLEKNEARRHPSGIGAEEINVTSPMKQTSIVIVDLTVHRKLLLHLVCGGGLVFLVVEQA